MGPVGEEVSLAARRRPQRPNVLLIVTDDQRGGMQVMPSVRRYFRRHGVGYPNAFNNTPLCCPARASILTGRYAHNHLVRRNSVKHLKHRSTLPSYLRRAGYRTALFGKYFNRWDVNVDPPNFHRWAFFPQSSARTYDNGTWNVEGEVRTVERYSTSYIRRRGVGFLRDREGFNDRAPWFLYLSPPAPHVPFIPSSRYEDAPVSPWQGNPAVRERDLGDKPRYIQSSNRECRLACGRDIRRRQFRTLMSVDNMVSAVFRTLERLEERNTIAFFVSDNGYLWGEHGKSNKRHPYTQANQIPMYLRWPGRVSRGRDRRFVGSIDLAPTILAAAGANPSDRFPIDGRSLLNPRWDRDRAHSEYWRNGNSPVPTWASTRTRSYQYIEYYEGETITFREYYDLVSDPWQLDNLLANGDPLDDPDPGTLERLSERLAGDRSCVGRRSCP